MSINIAGSCPIDDPEYRYKMPKLVTKTEGRGNGVRTVIVNCTEIASALHRKPPEVTRFFGYELGAQCRYDEETERSIVNGAFEAGDMQRQLTKYVESFVLCPQCRLPETTYTYRGQSISHKCYACGAIEPVDMNHKLTTFLLKKRAAEKRKGDDRKKKKKDKKEKSSVEDGSPGKRREKTEKKDKKDKKDSDKKDKRKKKKHHDQGNEGEEVDWHTDLSSEAVAARAQEAHALEQAASKVIQGDDEGEDTLATLRNLQVDDMGAIDAAIISLLEFLKAEHTTDEIVEEVRRHQKDSALPLSERLVLFFNAVVTDEVFQNCAVTKYAEVFAKLVTSESDQRQLIGLCESLCILKYPAMQNSFPVLLKLLYDEDVLDEEVLLQWESVQLVTIDAEQKAALKRSMVPFIEWLQNAEEESDEDE